MKTCFAFAFAPTTRRMSLATVAASLALSACVAEREPAATVGQPALATYACGDNGSLRIESAGSRVRVTHLAPTDPEAETEEGDAAPPETVELAAAPPGQTSRFDHEGYALVVEGSEALYMKAGDAPLTCVR